MLKRRNVLAAAGSSVAASLARPAIAQPAKPLRFMAQGDISSLDPIWTSAGITRTYAMAVYDTLFGEDEGFATSPQMLAGAVTSAAGTQWDLTLRDGLKFHDGAPVLARDCVASIRRFGERDPFGLELMAYTDELSAMADQTIRFRLKRPFPRLPTALASYTASIMPERIASKDAFAEVTESIGSGPFRFDVAERQYGSKAFFDRFDGYVPRPDGVASYTAGPKTAHFDRVEWLVPPDPATCAAALMNDEVDWWQDPTIDLVPQLSSHRSVTVTVKDLFGYIGCLRFNSLNPPFDNPEIRRIVMSACNQAEFMEAAAGAVPSLIKTDVGIFVPGTPLASTRGVEVTRGRTDYEAVKSQLKASGYKGEKVVLLGPTIPVTNAISEVAADVLKKIGLNVDLQTLDFGTIGQRRGSKQPIDKGGWSIFMTYLNSDGNVSPAQAFWLRGNGSNAWFGWPTNARLEALHSQWFTAPNLSAEQAICADMQTEYFSSAPYVALGMFSPPTAFRKTIDGIRKGSPQFYDVRRI